jgi:xanthine dehydrogenase accessory factor
MDAFYEELGNLNYTKENIACTVLEGEGTGTHALFENGVKTGEPDAFFTEHAAELTSAKSTGVLEIGGRKVFLELLGSQKKMTVCGGGHVSVPVIRIAKMTGFEVTVLEDRPLFADHARAAGADRVICDSFAEGLKKVQGDTDSYFVILTRGHRYDMECLRDLLKKKYAYIGMIGSRARVARAKEVLHAEGYTEAQTDSLHSPIGLSIAAETPEEIAVAILAEIIQVKNSEKRTGGYDREILKALQSPGAKVLATIISREGSAPRSIGTKMAVLEDGRCIGTIGGGCAESEIIGQALQLLRRQETGCRMNLVDMTAKEAEDDGMVCGGRIRVFLEPVYTEEIK